MLQEWLKRCYRRLPADQQSLRGFGRALFLPIHTHLLVLAFLLFWYLQRQYVASFHHVVLSGALISGIFTATRILLLARLGNLHKAALVASLLCVLVLFFNDLRGALAESFQALHIPLQSRLRYDLVLFGLLFGTAITWVARTRRSLVQVTQAAEVFSLVLVCLVGIQILDFTPLAPAKSPVSSLESLNDLPTSTKPPRDIYLILVDSRTSSSALKRYWNYDDTGFTSELQRLGFQCPQNATSEYFTTPHCISTLLNMETPRVPTNLQPKGIVSYLARSIRDSRVAGFLDHQGYEIVNLSLFDLLDQPRFYAFFEKGSYFSIFASTLPGVLWRDYLNHAYLKGANEKILSELARLPTRFAGRPRFVYAHLMMPHDPYLYDSHGQTKPMALVLSNKMDSHAYLEQLIYTDQLILKTVRSILSQSKTPPIILVRGDHGFRHLPPPDRDAEEREAFFAAYFPDNRSLDWPANVSHAMVFRDILNRYFGTSIPLE